MVAVVGVNHQEGPGLVITRNTARRQGLRDVRAPVRPDHDVGLDRPGGVQPREGRDHAGR